MVSLLKRARDGQLKNKRRLSYCKVDFYDRPFDVNVLCKHYFQRTRNLEYVEHVYEEFITTLSDDEDELERVTNQMVLYFDRQDTEKLNIEACNTRVDDFISEGMPLTVKDAMDILNDYEKQFLEFYKEEIDAIPDVPAEDGCRLNRENELYSVYEKYIESIVLFLNFFFVACSSQTVTKRMYDSKKKKFVLSTCKLSEMHNLQNALVLTNIEKWRRTSELLTVSIKGRRVTAATVDIDYKPLVQVWWDHPARFTAATVLIPTFLGNEVSESLQLLNTWQQFEIQRVHASPFAKNMNDSVFVRMILHIRYTWCDSDDQFLFVIGWMAFLIQRPDVRSESAIGVLGEQGTGKSEVFNWLLRIIGQPHGVATSNEQDLVGQFAGANRDSIFTFVDDAAAKGTTPEELKTKITSETRRVEMKYKPAMVAPNFITWAFANNAQLPLADDQHDRRLHCIYSNVKPWMYLHGITDMKAYVSKLFEDVKQSKTALHTFAAFLYSIDLSVINNGQPFDHRQVPASHCADMIRYQRKADDPMVQWWQWRINNKNPTASDANFGFNTHVTLDSLRNGMQADGFKSRTANHNFTMETFQLKCQQLEIDDGAASYYLPDQATCVREFNRNNPGAKFVNDQSAKNDVKWRYITNNAQASYENSNPLFGQMSEQQLERIREQVYENFLPVGLRYRLHTRGRPEQSMLNAIRYNNVDCLSDWQYRTKVLLDNEFI